ncbi:MAG TPA: hypothetical protein DEA46_04880 [Candidatus Moranbacteria bacterium]|nr:hypothetical protein [Candidatus Moranbacteria bacterium]
MPELPEVETIVNDLNKKIVSYRIVDFWSEWENGIKGVSLKKFQAGIAGRKILRVRRIGKNIFIDLSGGKTMYVHLKMTGHLLLKAQRGQKNFKFKILNLKLNICPHSSRIALERSVSRTSAEESNSSRTI